MTPITLSDFRNLRSEERDVLLRNRNRMWIMTEKGAAAVNKKWYIAHIHEFSGMETTPCKFWQKVIKNQDEMKLYTNIEIKTLPIVMS